MNKKELEEKVFDQFTDDFWSILTTYIEVYEPTIEDKDLEQVGDNIIRRIAKFYSKH